MNQEQFEETLRQFLRREPFQPFVVEMLNGRLIEVHHPGVAFGGGAASYLTSNYELERFECENVRAIRLAAHEIAS
jgi:hypothetical protein